VKTAAQPVREPAQGWRGSTAFSLSDEQYRRIDRIAERVMVLFLGVVIVWFLSECARTVAVSGWSFLISGGAR
jgi:hypothetical protein